MVLVGGPMFERGARSFTVKDWSARGFVEVSVQVLLCDFERRFGLLQPGGKEGTLKQRDNQSREGVRIHQGIHFSRHLSLLDDLAEERDPSMKGSLGPLV